MLHRALFGSVERFFGTLIEHYAGNFPLWLSPVQTVIIPINPAHDEFAKTIEAQCRAEGLRVQLDARNESLGKRIRDARLQRTPYILIIGDKELEAQAVTVRKRPDVDLGPMPLEAFFTVTRKDIVDKK